MNYQNEYMPITCSAYTNLPVPYGRPHTQMAPLQGTVMGGIPMPTLPTGVPVGGGMSSAVPTSPAIQNGVSGQMPMNGLSHGLVQPVMNGVTQGPIQPVMNGATPGTQVPVTVENPLYTAGFLRTQIGRRIRVEFLLGTNLLTDRSGTLVAVGASYILIRLVDSDDLMMCDIYSIKFVTILL